MVTPYQSFSPGGGNSQSLEKLRALKLPDLEGKSILDVGCNEGFFCWYAVGVGAARAVGIDFHPEVIEIAKRRVSKAVFLCQDFDDDLPAQEFDVIIAASMLHYSDDPSKLIKRLISMLTADGLLVLELGLSNQGAKDGWEKVDRSIDVRYFPTAEKLADILGDSAWRRIGPSVCQAGDPISRWVYHVRRRRPFLLIVTGPSNSGKTTLVRQYFGNNYPNVLRVDDFFFEVAVGTRITSSRMAENLRGIDLINSVNLATDAVLSDSECIAELLNAIMDIGPSSVDYVLDIFLRPSQVQLLCEACSILGFVPWVAQEPVSRLAVEPGDVSVVLLNGSYRVLGHNLAGAVDGIRKEWNGLHVGGWAVADGGKSQADSIAISIYGEMHQLEIIERFSRRDVCEAGYCLADVDAGFDGLLRFDVDIYAKLHDLPISLINANMTTLAFDTFDHGSVIGRAPVQKK